MRHMLVCIAVFFYSPRCSGQDLDFFGVPAKQPVEQQAVSTDLVQKLFDELVAERPGEDDLTKLMRERLRTFAQ